MDMAVICGVLEAVLVVILGLQDAIFSFSSRIL